MGMIADWFEQHREKFLKRVHEFLEPEEEISEFLMVKTAPSEILDWLPVVRLYYVMKTRRYAVILTQKRVLQLEHDRMDVMNLREAGSYPLADIARMELKNHVLFADLFITTGGQTLQFKDVDKTEGRKFVDLFKAARKGSRAPDAPAGKARGSAVPK